MDLTNVINLLTNLRWQDIIFQIVAVILSVGYLGYALVYHQQLKKMARNALVYEYLLDDPQNQKPTKTILYSFSLLQLLLGAVLLIMSLFFLNLA